ncbi:UDP-2,3-diacylglucosamine pyrophosphatase LpxH [Chryseobacterium vietnamense]|jgi:UDP-2,3-diacylglucosamine pyrophosphatase LpxH|uniref:UDP-2,3-diacylglucosamine pyrophosphatase LpxH n=1 Tax=Chryseobacterium vietnamense TaxID=866785 RepID=A0ACC6JBG1_9FLAO|nr:UDP-2,3-diacylglucosamine diphosphatase [Chryseobacterium vietnamense]MDR6460331.1 UDP-2,3-diacylglucosamine pyrophosphatase LpxH [Chryseobacterium vietnamense]MDR6488730.1 UDP-2,3-diacylglucosamine pyrophosphatase LpxH [Chryseobacterium vietnamense]
MKRNVELVVISDVHLGTYGCKAKELLRYLNSIQPKTLVLNGDIIDIWQFKKSYFPKPHLKVIRKILSLATKNTDVYYITGNHDEMFRKFTDFELGKLKVCNKICLNIDQKKTWIFHGDVFDASVQHSKWIAKLGGKGYDLLIIINNVVNWFLEKMGKEKYSFSKKIKNNVKKAVKYIGDFELTASELAIDNQYDYVVCGHIHQPQIREVVNKKGACTYLNSGDWIENLSALEYHDKEWRIFYYDEHKHLLKDDEAEEIPEMDNSALLKIVTNFS